MEEQKEKKQSTLDANRIIISLNQQISDLNFQITLLKMRNEDLEKQLEEAVKSGGEK